MGTVSQGVEAIRGIEYHREKEPALTSAAEQHQERQFIMFTGPAW